MTLEQEVEALGREAAINQTPLSELDKQIAAAAKKYLALSDDWRDGMNKTLRRAWEAENDLSEKRLQLSGLVLLIHRNSTFIEIADPVFNQDHERLERDVWGMVEGQRHTRIGCLVGEGITGLWTSVESRTAFWDWFRLVVEV